MYLHKYPSRFALVFIFLFAGFLLMLFYFLKSLFFGKRVPEAQNPWGGQSLEWQIASPPITHNFEETPHVTGLPYEYGVKI